MESLRVGQSPGKWRKEAQTFAIETGSGETSGAYDLLVIWILVWVGVQTEACGRKAVLVIVYMRRVCVSRAMGRMTWVSDFLRFPGHTGEHHMIALARMMHNG